MKRNTRAVFLATTLSGVGCSVLAQEYRNIDGDCIFTIDGANSLVELGFIVRGQAVREFYPAMPFMAKADAGFGGVKDMIQNAFLHQREIRSYVLFGNCSTNTQSNGRAVRLLVLTWTEESLTQPE